MRLNWTCPFCNHPTTIGDDDVDDFSGENYTPSADEMRSVRGRFIVCPNPSCKKLTLTMLLLKVEKSSSGNRIVTSNITDFWHLIPDSIARIFSPEVVPQAVINDYEEACKIKNLSPKSSATLARRALQGMIRDFWKIKKPEGFKGYWNLKNEIDAIKDKVDLDVWEAIDAVRKVGNIGAHMEEDVNVVIDVEPDEAEKLINLIELLIEEWYINRHERKDRLLNIKKLAETKGAQKLTNV